MGRKNLTPYEKVLEARKADRTNLVEYIDTLFEDFIEMHGDRLYRDDPSIIGGIALFHGMPVTVIGHRKGKNTEENVRFNFGMTSPEGYRKAMRLMKEAEKFERPVITFVDTPGAYPGLEAESNGQSNAIAESIALMSRLKVPTISIVTGEGSSGGALALAMADRVWMLEHSVYSILSPEGFSTIMWKDRSKAAQACEIMKITAKELKEYGIIDGIIPEGKRSIAAIDKVLSVELSRLKKNSGDTLVKNRLQKFRRINESAFKNDAS
ncbi:MAG: acetyl-CoA carboxylase carboxyltransferase subunit alpha [Eubacteriales bacterium]|nr:acetyl-CoA carboxylase carboxyltransferase subunit alpha [Eubacteriales bacterium]